MWSQPQGGPPGYARDGTVPRSPELSAAPPSVDPVDTIWVSEWQFGCCGDLFGVGDEVVLDLAEEREPSGFEDLLGADVAATVRFSEDHHEVEDSPSPTLLRVARLRAVFVARAPREGGDPREHHVVPGTTVLVDVDRLERGLADHDGLRHEGWLIDADLAGDMGMKG